MLFLQPLPLEPGTSINFLCFIHNSYNRDRIHSSADIDDAPTTARDKFGNQKAISSDMYFGRGSYDPVAVSEAQTRLQNFSGATSISSNQYFGREEDDLQGVPGGGGGERGRERLER